MGQLKQQSLYLRPLEATDTESLHKLINQSYVLDKNSTYCNLLQCTHFRDTSVAAVVNNELVGFVTAYVPPSEPATLFIWQLAVNELHRGTGLARKMINWLVSRPGLNKLTQLSATLAPDNCASRGLFESLAYEWGAALDRRLMDQPETCSVSRKDEYEFRIAPLPNREPVKDIAYHLDMLKAGFRNPLSWGRFD